MKRKHRLSRSADFERVYRKGKSVASRYAVLYYFDRDDSQMTAAPRMGVSVSKKVGGAVERNHVKRTLKEVFRASQERLAPGFDYVIIARPGLAEYIDKSQFSDTAGMVLDLFRRAGLIQETD